MSDLGCADEEAAKERSDGEHIPTPSGGTQARHPRGARTAVRKHSNSSQTTGNR